MQGRSWVPIIDLKVVNAALRSGDIDKAAVDGEIGVISLDMSGADVEIGVLAEVDERCFNGHRAIGIGAISVDTPLIDRQPADPLDIEHRAKGRSSYCSMRDVCDVEIILPLGAAARREAARQSGT